MAKSRHDPEMWMAGENSPEQGLPDRKRQKPGISPGFRKFEPFCRP